MVSFAGEVRRPAPAHFIQTPYFRFPFEPHFGLPTFHWLPEPVMRWAGSEVNRRRPCCHETGRLDQPDGAFRDGASGHRRESG